jgi:hypothetical protein
MGVLKRKKVQMNKKDERVLSLLRDAIGDENQTGDLFKDQIKSIQKSIFDEGGLEKSLEVFITELKNLGPRFKVPVSVIDDWFEAESFENGGGFLANGLLDLIEFGKEELEVFFDKFLYHHEEDGLDIDAMIKMIRHWFKSGGHKDFFAKLSEFVQ